MSVMDWAINLFSGATWDIIQKFPVYQAILLSTIKDHLLDKKLVTILLLNTRI